MTVISIILLFLLILQGGLIVWLLRNRKQLKRTTRELQNNHNQLHSWLLHSPISISVFKKNGETVEVNERFTQLLGYETSDFRDANEMWSILIQDDFKREKYVRNWAEQLDRPWSSKWQAEEVLVTGKSGRVKSIETHVSKIGDFWICLHNDVTWRTQIERELENALNQTFKANIAKTQFLTNMSHEIRTPLNGVLGMAQLLSETKMTEDQRSFVDTIQKSGEMLLMTISDILDLSKIEAGSLDLESTPFNLLKCINDSVDVCLPKLNRSKVTFQSLVDPKVPSRIRGDPYRISQIITNLLSNAFKYTQEGSVTLRVYDSSEKGSQARLTISVKDTGIGIPLEKQNSIFEPFVQADASITRQYGGTGLGLTICKRLADKMGGEITIASQPGVGSEFTFSWSPEKLQREHSPSSSSERSIPLSETPFPEDFTTLVVEDNFVNSKVIELSLKKNGISISKAANGKEALELLKKQTFDLVFMDIQMPELDGLKCTEIIRREFPDLSQPFIIALTAHALADHMEQCRRVGMNGFLAKPYTNDELRKAIQLFLAERHNPRTHCHF